jgi:hypothetical protein
VVVEAALPVAKTLKRRGDIERKNAREVGRGISMGWCLMWMNGEGMGGARRGGGARVGVEVRDAEVGSGDQKGNANANMIGIGIETATEIGREMTNDDDLLVEIGIGADDDENISSLCVTLLLSCCRVSNAFLLILLRLTVSGVGLTALTVNPLRAQGCSAVLPPHTLSHLSACTSTSFVAVQSNPVCAT